MLMKRKLVYYKKQIKLIFSRLQELESGKYCKFCAYDDDHYHTCKLYRKYGIDHTKLLCAQDIYKNMRDNLINKKYMYVVEENNTVQRERSNIS